MKSSAKNIQVTTYEDLFSMGQAGTVENVQEIALSELYPFQVLDDAAMKELVESIRKRGGPGSGTCPSPEGERV